MNRSNITETEIRGIDYLIDQRKWKEASILLKEIRLSIKKSEDIKMREWFYRKSAKCDFEMAQNEPDLRKRYSYLKSAEVNAQYALSISEKLKNMESSLELYVLLANTANQKKAKDTNKVENFADSKINRITKKVTTGNRFQILLVANSFTMLFLIGITEWDRTDQFFVLASLNILLIFLMTTPLNFIWFRSYFRYYKTKYGYEAREAYFSTYFMFIVSCGIAFSIIYLLVYFFLSQTALALHWIFAISLVLLLPISYFWIKIPRWKKTFQELEELNFKQNNEKEIENRKNALLLLEAQDANEDVYVDNLEGLITALTKREVYSRKESSIGESIDFQKRSIKLFREKGMKDRMLRIYRYLANSLSNLSEISSEPRSQFFLGKSLLLQCLMLEKKDLQLKTLRKAKETFSVCKYSPTCRVYLAYTQMILPLLEFQDITNIEGVRKEVQTIISQITKEEIPPDDKYIFFSEDFVEIIQDIADSLLYFEKLKKEKELIEKKECLSELHTTSELILSRKGLTEIEEFFVVSILRNIRMISRPIIIQIEEGLKKFKKVPLDLYNPYNPVRNPRMFFGRDDIFDFIEQELKGKGHSVILIHGQRRIGKTSLLLQLKNRMGEEFVPVFIDMQGIIDPGDHVLFYGFARDIQETLSQKEIDIDVPSREEFKEAPSMVFEEKVINTALEAIGSKSLVLMIDEFERLEQRISTGKSKREILIFLRHLVQHTERFSCILAGAHKIEELIMPEWKTFLTTTISRKIGVLSKEDMEDLIRDPVREYHLTYTDDAIEEIWRTTGGHPCLTHAIGSKLVEYHNNTRKNELSKMDVASILEDVVEIADPVFVVLWDYMSRKERLVLVSLKRILQYEEQTTKDTLKNFLDFFGTPIDSNKLDRVLQDLEYKELIYPVNDKYPLSFRSDLIRMWIEKYKNDGK